MEKKRMENKMQDSQKTKDELWNRLWKEFGQLVYMESMNEHVKMGANGDLVDFISQELDRAREEGRKERTDELKQAFHEVFYKSGELWFNYIFEDGDTKAEQEAKGVVEDYWDEIISKLSKKK